MYLGAGLVTIAVYIRIVPTPIPMRHAAVVSVGLLGVAVLAVAVNDITSSQPIDGGDDRSKDGTDTQSDRSSPPAEASRSSNWESIRRRRLIDIVGSLPAILVSIASAGTAIASVVYPPTYVWRVLAWRESDVYDYLSNFPQRDITAAPSPHEFEEALNEATVADAFGSVLTTDDFDTFLTETDTQAFIVIHDGCIVYESYFDDWHRDSLLTSFSVAKAFTSTLVGIAIEDGHIGGLDDPVTEYLPELRARDSAFANITIRHLLTMSSGLDYQAVRWGLFNGDDPLTTYHPDQRHLSLYNTDPVESPGNTFRYNKYHPQLLGMIIERTTGMSVTEWTQSRLWTPLGMEFDGAWCLDSADNGFEKMEAGLNARAIDFAKLGQLFLDSGELNGERVVSSEWVALASGTDPAGRAPPYSADSYYAFMWWGFEREDGPPDFAAVGDHGQFVYVSPATRLVIVRNGRTWGVGCDEWTDAFYRAATLITD